MKKVSAGIGALAATGAALLGTMALAGPAAAKSKCPVPKSSLVPHLTSPCNGASFKKGAKVTFKATDRNSKAGQYHPYLNLQTKRTLVHGHLKADSSGKGIFTNLKGKGAFWSLTEGGTMFPGYWSNTPGTYYVQVQQIDARAGNDTTFYSPIITIHIHR